MGTKRDPSGGKRRVPLDVRSSSGAARSGRADLEDGQIGLDESLAKYEEGRAAFEVCRESLQIRRAKDHALDGNRRGWQSGRGPFAEEASSLEEKKECPDATSISTGNRQSRNDSRRCG